MITRGTQQKFLAETKTGSGSTTKEGTIGTDSLLASLWVSSISGSITVNVYSLTEEGKEELLFSFPTVDAPTTELLVRKSGVSFQNFRIQADYTGACDYEIYVRSIEGAGAASTRILGASSFRTSQIDIDDSAPQVLVPSALEDRASILIKNWNQNGDVYLSEDSSKLPDDAFPLGPRDCLFVDLEAGQTLYAIAATGTVDVRIIETGGT